MNCPVQNRIIFRVTFLRCFQNGPIIIEPDAGATPVFDLGGTKNTIRFFHSYYIFRNIELKIFNQGIKTEGAEYVVIR